MIQLFSKIWSLVDEPRVHRLLVGTRYLVGVALGIIILNSAEYFNPIFLGTPIAVAGGLTFIVGSVLGVSFSWTRRWIFERPATMLVILGSTLGVYLSWHASLISQSPWYLTAMALFTMHIISMVKRYVEIISDDYEISISEEEIKSATDEILRPTD